MAMIFYERVLDSGMRIQVVPMTFGKARLCIGPDQALWYDDGWCYDNPVIAIAQAITWDPEKDKEPDFWMRHIKTGRRRPDGDHSKEYVSP